MAVTVDAPRIEHHRSPFGIGEAAPRVSWVITSAPAGWTQQSYRLTVGIDSAHGDFAAHEERFEVASADQVLVPWPAAPPRLANSCHRERVRAGRRRRVVRAQR